RVCTNCDHWGFPNWLHVRGEASLIVRHSAYRQTHFSRSDQLFDGPSHFHEGVRAAGRVGDVRVAGVDAEVAVERGEHVLVMHRTRGRLRGVTIRAADDLAGFQSAAGHDAHRDLRPVI